jgi:AcrR family transcriptional regulator
MAIRHPSSDKHEAGPASGRSLEILDTAVEVFASCGFAQTDVQVIADRVGIGKGTVYRHFGNKESLFLAAVKHARDKLICTVDASQDPTQEPLKQLRICMTAILQFFDFHPEIVELLIEERALFRDRRPSLFFEHDENRKRKWAMLLKEMIADGIIRDIPVAQIQDTISRFVFGAMFFNYFEGNRKPIANQADTMFDILFSGLMTDSQKSH